MKKTWFSNPLLAMAVCLCLVSGRPATAASPDVMVSVEAQDPATGQPDEVVLSYVGQPSETVMRQDVDALRLESGWSVQDLRLERGTASFITQNTVPRQAGRLPVSTVVTALRHYRRLIVVFDVLGSFTYTGHTYYHDANIEIAMEPQVSGSKTFGFNVTVVNPAFGPISMGDSPRQPAPLSPVRVLLALLAAGLIGVAVYLVFLRITARTEPAANPCAK